MGTVEVAILSIIACVSLMEIIPIYTSIGYLPFVQPWGVGGLKKSWELYPLAFVHGLAMGGLSSYCRSFFGLLMPPGHEVTFYALYTTTEKGNFATRPAIVRAIVDATGYIRPAFFFWLGLIALPGPLIWLVYVEKGQRDAIAIVERAGGRNAEAYDLAERTAQTEEDEGLLATHD